MEYSKAKLKSNDASRITIRVIKSSRMRWTGHVGCIGEVRNAYEIFVGKTQGKRPLGRIRCRWEHNSRTNLKEIEWESGGFIWLRIGTSSGMW
jgi:hypothetical protein